MNEPLLILGMMAVTFSVRYSSIVVAGRVRLPEPVLRALKFVPVAVLTAIVFPATLMPDGNLSLDWTNAYIIGAITAVLISWRTKSLVWTIVVSMAVFLLWRGLW